MTRPRLERYLNVFLNYFSEEVIAAHFDNEQHLIVYTTPYRNFDEMVMKVCEGLLNTVDFPDHLYIYLYPFGRNEYIKIAVN